jgi:hypothetical protein
MDTECLQSFWVGKEEIRGMSLAALALPFGETVEFGRSGQFHFHQLCGYSLQLYAVVQRDVCSLLPVDKILITSAG